MVGVPVGVPVSDIEILLGCIRSIKSRNILVSILFVHLACIVDSRFQYPQNLDDLKIALPKKKE